MTPEEAITLIEDHVVLNCFQEEWQTLKASVLEKQTTNSAMVQCGRHHEHLPCDVGFGLQCRAIPCMVYTLRQ